MKTPRFRLWAAFGLIAVALSCFGCESHPGRVLVVVDSDYRVPVELGEVRVFAGPADNPEDRRGQGFVLTSIEPPPAGTHRLPLSLVVTPRGGDSDRRVAVMVEGLASASRDVLVQSTRVLDGFRPGDTIVLPIFLSRNCGGVACDADRTCIDGRCESVEIDPSSLRLVEDPNEEFRSLDPRDAGDATIPDAAEDAPMDVRPPDGGTCGASPECTPGASESDVQPCACGSGTQTRTRTCDSTCRWRPWSEPSACTGTTGCVPGDTTDCENGDSCGHRVCQADCTWGDCEPILECLRIMPGTSGPEGNNWRCCGTRSWQFCLSTCRWSLDCARCPTCGC